MKLNVTAAAGLTHRYGRKAPSLGCQPAATKTKRGLSHQSDSRAEEGSITHHKHATDGLLRAAGGDPRRGTPGHRCGHKAQLRLCNLDCAPNLDCVL